MTTANVAREIVRALVQKDLALIGRDFNIQKGAEDELSRRIAPGVYVDQRGDLIAYSGEPALDYMRARLDHYRTSDATSFLFWRDPDTAAPVPQSPAAPRQMRAPHPESARQKLSRSNGVDPWEGL